MNIAILLDKLITKKYYENKTDIQNKLDVFYAMSKITDEEYTTLTLKVEQMYAEVVEVVTEDEVEVVTEGEESGE